jgi:hypothetical protein
MTRSVDKSRSLPADFINHSGVAVMVVRLAALEKVSYVIVRRQIKVHSYRNNNRRLISFINRICCPGIYSRGRYFLLHLSWSRIVEKSLMLVVLEEHSAMGRNNVPVSPLGIRFANASLYFEPGPPRSYRGTL